MHVNLKRMHVLFDNKKYIALSTFRSENIFIHIYTSDKVFIFAFLFGDLYIIRDTVCFCFQIYKSQRVWLTCQRFYASFHASDKIACVKIRTITFVVIQQVS